jgi:hypothetical protein
MLKQLIKKYFISKAEMLKEMEKVQNEIHANRFLLGQFGDDGIIQFLLQQLSISTTTFIEFGVEKYTEANTRFLLMNDNWRGLVIDGDEQNIAYIQRDSISWRYDLTSICSFITAENINDLFVKNGFTGEIGILSVDIDGNDYWVWDKIKVVKPAIVIVEYNSVFGTLPITIPYQSDFVRTKAHYSNLFWGTSLGALYYLAEKKGYYFVGTNSAGNNAYFVRKNELNLDNNPLLPPLSLEAGFTDSKFRESRNQEGELTYLRGKDRLQAIKECEVFHVLENKILKIKDLI